jgi:hypothetical protein
LIQALDGMERSTSEIEKLVASEVLRVGQPELAERIKKMLVPVRCETREWDYGEPGKGYPCWIVAEHPDSNTAFAYCEHGFGPGYPWGLLSIAGQHMSMGMDCGWFVSLEEAFRDSFAWDGSSPAGYESS